MKFFSLCLILIANMSLQLMAEPALEGGKQKEKGRIVVNIRDNGDYTNEELEKLENEEALKIYIARQAALIEALNQKPVMHLRGSRNAVFERGRTAVRAAAEVGVNQVIFATFPPRGNKQAAPEPDPKPDAEPGPIRIPERPHWGNWFIKPLIKPRESDLDLALPKPAGPADGEAAIEPLIITIKGNGRILANNKPMDIDPNVRKLPLLDAALQFYKEGVEAAGEKPLVKIFASDDTPHQRVIDVLNSLAGVGINSVTFTDLTKEEQK